MERNQAVINIKFLYEWANLYQSALYFINVLWRSGLLTDPVTHSKTLKASARPFVGMHLQNDLRSVAFHWPFKDEYAA